MHKKIFNAGLVFVALYLIYITVNLGYQSARSNIGNRTIYIDAGQYSVKKTEYNIFEIKKGDTFASRIDRIINAGIRNNAKGIRLANSDKEYLLKAARKALDNHASRTLDQVGISDFENAPVNVAMQRAWVCVTIVTDGILRGCQSARGGSLLDNTLEAMHLALEDKRFGKVLTAEEVPRTRIDITILFNPRKLEGSTIEEQANRFS